MSQILTLIRKLRTIVRKTGFDGAPWSQTNPDYAIEERIRRFGIDTILDIGANRGQFGRATRDYGYTQAMHSFEPLPDAYEALLKQARRSRNWFAHQFALGAKAEQTVLHIGLNDQTSSLSKVDAVAADGIRALETVGSVEVEVRRLDDFFRDTLIDPARAFVKIDVQGTEAAVLEGAGAALDRIPLIQMETALATTYETETRLVDMITLFAAKGLDTIGIRPVYFDPRTGALMQVDLIVSRAITR